MAAGAPLTLRRDIGCDLVYYVEENKGHFPGVEVQRVFVRRYPHGTLAAHVLGNVGEINEEELKEPRYRGLEPGEEIGQEGVEYTYDRYLRGKPGMTRIQVDALGEPTPGGQLVSKPPVPGDNLKLTLDKGAGSGRTAMAERGLPGGFITMNIDTGEILGLGSFPTYDPDLHPPSDPEASRRDIPKPGGAADRPGDRRSLPHRFDLQDHHRPGVAGKRRAHRRRRSTTPAFTVGGETFHDAGGAA